MSKFKQSCLYKITTFHKVLPIFGSLYPCLFSYKSPFQLEACLSIPSCNSLSSSPHCGEIIKCCHVLQWICSTAREHTGISLCSLPILGLDWISDQDILGRSTAQLPFTWEEEGGGRGVGVAVAKFAVVSCTRTGPKDLRKSKWYLTLSVAKRDTKGYTRNSRPSGFRSKIASPSSNSRSFVF